MKGLYVKECNPKVCPESAEMMISSFVDIELMLAFEVAVLAYNHRFTEFATHDGDNSLAQGAIDPLKSG